MAVAGEGNIMPGLRFRSCSSLTDLELEANRRRRWKSVAHSSGACRLSSTDVVAVIDLQRPCGPDCFR
jgi:hypothetical protein